MADYTLEPIDQKTPTGYTLEPVQDGVTSWRQGQEPSIFERISDIFTEDATAQSAKAANALAYSEMLHISPSTAYDYHDEISKQVQDKLNTEKIITERKGIAGAVSSGIDTSLFGMMAKQKVPEPFESVSQAERWVQGMVTMGIDLPFFMAGYVVGGGNPVSGTAGAFGFNAGMRKVLMDRYAKGEVKDADEWFKRVGDAAKETIKGEVVGGMVGGAGVMAPVWLQKLAPGAVPSVGWKASLELATMTAAGKLIEGQLPTARDLVDNAAILLTMHAGITGYENIKARIPEIRAQLQEAYTETGVHPKDIAEIITSNKLDPKEDISDAIDRTVTEIKQTLPLEPAEKAKEETPKAGENVQPGATSKAGGGDATSIKNASVDAERLARGEQPIETPTGERPKDWREQVQAKVDSGEIDPRAMAEKINNLIEIGEKPPVLSDEGNQALLYDKQIIKNELNSIYDEIKKNGETPELSDRRDTLESVLNANERATKAAGTEQGRALQSRQDMMNEDYSLAAMIQNAKNDGITITPEVRAKYEKISKKIEKAQKDLDNHGEKTANDLLTKTVKQLKNEEGLKQRKQGREVKKEELDTEFNNLIDTFMKEHGSEFSANPFADPARYKFLIDLTKNRIRKGVVAAEDIVDSIHVALKNAGIELSKRDIRDAISQYGVTREMSKDEIRTQLNEAKRQMKLLSALEDAKAGIAPAKSGINRVPDSARIKELRAEINQAMRENGLTDTKTPEELRHNAFRKLRERQISEYERRIKEGDFSKKEKPVPITLNDQETKLQFQLDSLKHDYEKARMEDMLSQRGPAIVLKDSVFEAINLIKAVKSSFDLSAFGRQGFFALVSHPIKGFRNIPEMIRAFGSDEAAFRIAKEISERGNFKNGNYKDANLSLTESGGGGKAEEMYKGRWAQLVPGIPASERAFVAFMNLMRSDLFDSMHKYAFENKKATTEELRALGDYVNTATGRGTLKGYESALQGLGNFMWAPKLVLSRFQMILGKGLMPGGGRTAATRKAVAREYARILGGLAVIYAVNSVIGNPIETDPRSSDFGKIVIGKTRIDLLAGVSQATVFLSRIISGETKSITTKSIKSIRGDNVPYGGKTTWDVIANFMRTKLTPALGLAINLVGGKDLIGNKVTVYDIPKETIVPLAVMDLYQAMNQEGIPAGMALGILSIFGIGIQTYEQKGARP